MMSPLLSRIPIHRLILFVTTANTLLSSLRVAHASRCYDQTVAYENFEGTYDKSWKNGATEYQPGFSSFLGRLGEGREYASKSFAIPPEANSATMSFWFYQIDLWCTCDIFNVLVCGEQVYLGQFSPGNRGKKHGRTNDITWESHNIVAPKSMGFSQYKDQVHEIVMTFPQRCWTEVTPGGLDVRFNLTIHGDLELASAGIDNLNITAHNICPSEAPSSEPSKSPTAAPSFNPTSDPSAEPTANPSMGPSAVPSASPSARPSTRPSIGPTAFPTVGPSANPTVGPTAYPTVGPTAYPTVDPTSNPTGSPTHTPTVGPTVTPTGGPSDAPTVAPSENPTIESTLEPTAFPTIATSIPTRPRRTPPKPASDVCLETNDMSGQECFPLSTEESMDAGVVCIQVVMEDSDLDSVETPALEVSFMAVGDWTLIQAMVWVGNNGEGIEYVPKDSNGTLDLKEFPHFWCESKGAQAWTTTIPLSCDRDLQELQHLTVLAHAEVQELQGNGALISGTNAPAYAYQHVIPHGHNQDWLAWVDAAVDCMCSIKPRAAPPKPQSCSSASRMYLKSAPDKECHTIVHNQVDRSANERNISAPVGTICISIIEDPSSAEMLNVTITANEGHKLLRSQVWVGEDIFNVPMSESGTVATQNFDNFACDFRGLATISFPLDFNGNSACTGRDEFQLSVVAHSLAVRVDGEGNLLIDTAEDVFAFEFDGPVTNREMWYGYFDFTVGCECQDDVARRASPTSQNLVSPQLMTCIASEDGSNKAQFDLIAETVGKPLAGIVSVEMRRDILKVSVASVSDYGLWETNLWVGENTSLPTFYDDGVPYLQSYPFGKNGLEGGGTSTFKIPSVSADYCIGVDEYTLALVVHALVGRHYTQSNDTFVGGTESDAYAVVNDSASTKVLELRIWCSCSDHPKTTQPPTASPVTLGPTVAPATQVPSQEPSGSPSEKVSATPSATPTDPSTKAPSIQPTGLPSALPVPPCVKSSDGTRQSCLNLTAYGPWSLENQLLGPKNPWAGFVCMSLNGTENLEVTFQSTVEWDLWEAHVWLDADGSSMPMDDDGVPDLPDFPYQNEHLDGADSWSFSIPIHVTAACESAKEFTFAMVSHAVIGKNYVPNNGTYKPGTDWDAWVQDVTDVKQSENRMYTSFDLTIFCECSPDRLVRLAPPLEPALISQSDTCITANDRSGQVVFNLTAYGPYEPWAGFVRLGLVNGSALEVTFESAGYWHLWEAQLWLGEDVAALPQNNGYPDYPRFPYTNGLLKGSNRYKFPVYVYPKICSVAESATLQMVAHAIVGENKVLPDGKFAAGTDYEAWAMDHSDGKNEVNEKTIFTTQNITFQCSCLMSLQAPSSSPSSFPSSSPSDVPSNTPSEAPSRNPSYSPTLMPTSSLCHHAWGYYAPSPLCFSDVNSEYPGGWSNGPVSFYAGTVTMDLVLQSQETDCTIGVKVGDITFTFDGMKLETVAFKISKNQTELHMTETHLYIGDSPMYNDGTGNVTNPAHLPLTNVGLGEARGDNYLVQGLSDLNFVIAHAIVCGERSNEEERRQLDISPQLGGQYLESPKLRGRIWRSQASHH